ncbi:hypothetical protein [Streptomyces sp. S.PB5]|uniref:hypothetical protein n=1 Tax=Streptomyces sp. S.PB5 TaxID=3020844 RepID=UPI0025B2181C|nr:hypothetical protein [Streptomyces sp. S.PB5]MDN3027466.1 hypothetical protein [Streptomyces sp. S.PB5]
MTDRPVRADQEPVRTNGTLALVNLSAQIDGMAAPVRRAAPTAPLGVAQPAVLADLLTLRGHLLGRVADYERAAQLSEHMVRNTPDDSVSLLARARTRAPLHRFAEAMTDLDAAGRTGVEQAALDAERASILQAVGPGRPPAGAARDRRFHRHVVAASRNSGLTDLYGHLTDGPRETLQTVVNSPCPAPYATRLRRTRQSSPRSRPGAVKRPNSLPPCARYQPLTALESNCPGHTGAQNKES